MSQAYSDDCEYFYQSNDDVKYITPWIHRFVGTLRSNKVLSNFGVVGALDVQNRMSLTQSMVHRTHQRIFGQHFPDGM